MTIHFPWQEIDHIFLDMDGVLLDKYFDDYFWEEFVPAQWQQKNGGTPEQARAKLLATYKKVENTLAWCNLDYWSEQLRLDIPALKCEAREFINLRPKALNFLNAMREMDKPVSLVTNAHPKTLAVKMGKINLHPWFDRIVSAEEVGWAKEQPQFWKVLRDILPHRPERTFFADDTEKVLHAAEVAGIGYLLHIAGASSRLPPRFSPLFPSVTALGEVVEDVDLPVERTSAE